MKVFLKGVYFLYDGDKIVYVGQSNDIYRRIYEHSSGRAKGGKKKFDSWEYVEIENDESRIRFEAICIRAFRPRYNEDYPQIRPPFVSRKKEPENILELYDFMRSTSLQDLDRALCCPPGSFHKIVREGAIDKSFIIRPHGLFHEMRIDNVYIVENYQKFCDVKRRINDE